MRPIGLALALLLLATAASAQDIHNVNSEPFDAPPTINEIVLIDGEGPAPMPVSDLPPLVRVAGGIGEVLGFRQDGETLYVSVDSPAPPGEIFRTKAESDCPVNSKYQHGETPEGITRNALLPLFVAWTKARHPARGDWELERTNQSTNDLTEIVLKAPTPAR